MSRRVRRPAGTGPARRSVGRSVAELGMTAAALAVAAVLLVRPTTTVDAAPAASPATTPRLDPPAAALANPCTRGQVALTFDDGPGPYTSPILAVLRAYRAQATFFVLGEKARADAATVRAMVADGHTVGNHSWDHPHLADLDAATVRDQLVRTQEAIAAAGAPAPVLVRPPFGSGGRTVDGVAAELGLRPSSWTYDSEDWRGRRPADLANAVVENAQPGMSVLLHDGTADAQNTVEALPAIIEGLRSRGYCTAALR